MRRLLSCLVLASLAAAQSLPRHVADKLPPQDRTLFERLAKLEIESLWGFLNGEGYTNSFINDLTPLRPGERMVGRARTIRYLPNRKDLRERLYSAGPQLNYRASDDAQPGDVLVFDAGGETRSAVTGAMTATRFQVRGGAGMVADGAFRDTPELARMPIQTYLRRGHAASVAPLQLSVDYQLPVRIGGVTVIPGDILVGDAHGILVIPADLAERAATRAESTHDKEEFQRKLLLEGEPLPGVYPNFNEANQKKFEEWKKRR